MIQDENEPPLGCGVLVLAVVILVAAAILADELHHVAEALR